MTSKSELKIGDLVRRWSGWGQRRGAGMVIGIVGPQRSLPENPAALVKWFDTTDGSSLWYFNQLQKVIKE